MIRPRLRSLRSRTDELREQVHVWFVLQHTGTYESMNSRSVLSDDERSAADRFRLPALKERYALAHSQLRRILSCYEGTLAERWIFRRNRWGRPEIAWPNFTDLRFSLSYGEGLVATAVTRGVDVGLDLVSTQRTIDVLGVAEHAFARSEVADLRDRNAASRRDRFFDYWTLKEAYTKARGMGLWLKLDSFAFSFPRRGVIEFQPESEHNRVDWQFALAPAPLQHRMAVAVDLAAAAPRQIVARLAPGGDRSTLALLRTSL